MKVVLANFYSMARARERHDGGEFPAQYLFGGRALEQAGDEVVYIEASSGRLQRWLDRASRKLRWQLGDLAVQWEVLRRARGADVIYGAADEVLAGLALLRSFGLLRTPIVTFFHHPPRRKWLQPRAARGYDRVFTLSRVSRDALVDLGRSEDTTHIVSWGPALDWEPYLPARTDFVLSCGKSGRDIDTLAAALEGTELDALLYAPHGWHRPANPRIHVRDASRMPPYSTCMADMSRASVVAIPLASTERLYGLSELNDALAIGKPIVMTRTPHLDFDLEEIGCGFMVDPGDVDGWRAALLRLQSDRELRDEMGRRGRAFAERHWNDARSGEHIRAGLLDVVGATPEPESASTSPAWQSDGPGAYMLPVRSEATDPEFLKRAA